MTRTEEDLRDLFTTRESLTPPPGPTLVALRRNVTARRRRRMLGTVITAGVAAAAVAAAVAVVAVGVGPFALHQTNRIDPASPRPTASSTVSPAPQTTASAQPFVNGCTESALPLPAAVAALDENTQSNVRVAAMDPSGRYVVGYANASSGDAVAILWTGQTPQQLVMPQASPYLYTADVNSHGEVVGARSDRQTNAGDPPDAHRKAWIYKGGQVTDLTTPPGYASAEPTAINERGDVVGFAVKADGVTAAVRWPADQPAQPRILPAPRDARADDIGDDGTVVGVLSDATHGAAAGSNPDLPYVWDAQGSGRQLNLPPNMLSGSADRIRGDWVLGLAANTSTNTPVTVAAVWNLHSGQLASYPSDLQSFGPYALLLNAAGDILRSDGTQTVFIHSGHTDVVPDLPTRGAEGSDGRDKPVAVSDDGHLLAGEHVDSMAPIEPVMIWKC